MEIRPSIDLDFAVRGMGQSLRALWQAVGVGIGQSKRLAMQARPTSTGVLLRMSIHHAVFGQAHQGSADGTARQGFEIVAAVERDDWTRRIGVLGTTDRGDLVQSDLGGRLRRGSTVEVREFQRPLELAGAIWTSGSVGR
jgi:hypothetical protein